MTSPHETLQPEGWAQPRGYANGIAAKGRLVFVAGQIGWNAQGTLVDETFVGQARQALSNIVEVVARAGGRPEHIVRLTWYVADRREYVDQSRALGIAYRAVIGDHYPAMTAVEVAAFVEEGVRVEIEATAVVPED